MGDRVCSFCSEARPCDEIQGTGLHICDGCVEEIDAWVDARNAESIAHRGAALAAALPWEAAWNESHALGRVA